MAEDRELIFRILQESDDEDDEEIDKIIFQNTTKKAITAQTNKINLTKGRKQDLFLGDYFLRSQ